MAKKFNKTAFNYLIRSWPETKGKAMIYDNDKFPSLKDYLSDLSKNNEKMSERGKSILELDINEYTTCLKNLSTDFYQKKVFFNLSSLKERGNYQVIFC